ncbi:hypothetical protein BDV98DRAFT_589026 [Pterulicium gracile]|uniref:WW domain-containing protein n=1 Tax=Pterulicium gracile TaxID=1884261 RepID=A0A5C3QXR7_9AGAR|nr:hypothetical protein BDV98DRAFT_589026 [Pterula gracilis]
MSGKVAFKDAHHFTCINPHQPRSNQRWYCILCVGDAATSAHHYMTKPQAIAHEKTSHEHTQNLSNLTATVQINCSAKPTSEPFRTLIRADQERVLAATGTVNQPTTYLQHLASYHHTPLYATPMRSGTDDRLLPYGWTQQHDPNSDHVFYVDTKATPPRSIWVHPYDDPQFLAEHPDVEEKVHSDTKAAPPDEELPAYEKQASFSAHQQEKAPEVKAAASFASLPNEGESSTGKEKKRGMFSKMKDAALGGTKEEREAAKKRDQEWAESRRQQRMAYAPQYGSGSSYHPGSPVAGYPGAAAHFGPQHPPQFHQQNSYGPGPQHPPQFHQQNSYGPGPNPGYGHNNGYQPGPQQYQAPYPSPQGSYGYPQGPYGPPPPHIVYTQQPGGSGSGSMAVPVLGGIAGGVLLGSLLF